MTQVFPASDAEVFSLEIFAKTTNLATLSTHTYGYPSNPAIRRIFTQKQFQERYSQVNKQNSSVNSSLLLRAV